MAWALGVVGGRRTVFSRRTGPLRPYQLRCAGWREDTQQGTLATGARLQLGQLQGPSGREWNGLQPGQGATELGFPRPAPGEMQSEAARPSG